MSDPRLLVSDLDGTLLGDDESLARFAAWFMRHRAEWRLAYNSGRFFSSIVDVVRNTALPEPDVVIGGVGTEIRHFSDATEVVDPWPRAGSGWRRALIEATMRTFTELTLQPEELQAEFKISYFGDHLAPARLDEIRRRLWADGHRVNVIYSSSRDLDVLPAGVNKGFAATALADEWGLEPWQVFVAGDTGNDASMFAQGYRGIVVANAQPELERIHAPTIYHARSGFASGVREGLCYWIRLDNMAEETWAAGSCGKG